MDIDYATIIETANRRKDHLQQVEQLVSAAPEALKNLTCVRDYFQALHLAWAQLDQEGRKMLPPKVQEALSNADNKRSYADLMLGNVDAPAFHHGLKQLAPFAKDPT